MKLDQLKKIHPNRVLTIKVRDILTMVEPPKKETRGVLDEQVAKVTKRSNRSKPDDE